MVYITKITTQKKQKDRFNIYVNDVMGEKYAFSVDEDVLIKYQLKKGMELDEFTQIEVLYQDTIRKAQGMAIQYLSTRMRSEKEIREHLKQKEVEDTVIQEVIHKLYQLSYLNDEEFALAYLRTQINTTEKGPSVVKMELTDKGINQDIIDRILPQFTFEVQLEKILKLCEKVTKKKRNESQYIFEQKLRSALLRKGYYHSAIEEALSGLDLKLESDDLDAINIQGEKAIRKYGSDRMKVKQFLYRKGFSIESIDEYLRRLDQE